MKIWKSIFAAAIITFLLTGCGKIETVTETQEAQSAQTDEENRVDTTLFAMDTYMTLTAYGSHAQEALDAAEQEILRLDELLSTGNENSEIAQLNRNGQGTVSADVDALLQKSLELYDSTGGLFDITIYPLMNLWGFPTQEYRVPEESEIETVLQSVGSDKISYDKETGNFRMQDGMAVDFGGIAKGYTSSALMENFKQYGVTSAMVSLGGNVQVLGTKTDGSDWRVAIINPDDTDSYIGVLEIANQAVITSGGYERYFEEDGVTYHHIMDVRKGKPAESDLTSVTIVSEDGTLADGLSTSLFVMGKEQALDYWRNHADTFDAILVTGDDEIYITDGLDGKFSSDFSFEIVSHEK